MYVLDTKFQNYHGLLTLNDLTWLKYSKNYRSYQLLHLTIANYILLGHQNDKTKQLKIFTRIYLGGYPRLN